VKGYAFEVGCPTCEAPVEHIADGQPTSGDTRAIARCVRGHGPFLVVVSLIPIRDPNCVLTGRSPRGPVAQLERRISKNRQKQITKELASR
jgi:hypothetical protein